jgi:hypothetical protein
MRLLTPVMAMMVIASSFLIVAPAQAQTTPTLRISEGKLMGANDVSVNGSLYNVSFQAGTCSGLYDGCDDVSDFLFPTVTLAQDASNALLSQVFVDNQFGNFDSNPTLTNGCSFASECGVITAFQSFSWTMNGHQAQNVSGLTPDTVRAVSFTPRDRSTGGNQTYAIWAVPEPETYAMMLVGLGLIASVVRGRKLKGPFV